MAVKPIPEFFIDYHVPPLPVDIPDDENDTPTAGCVTPAHIGPLNIPVIVYGAATLSFHYTASSVLTSSSPFRDVRLALRYGINAFDTSPYYGESEILLGQILAALSPQFPRSSYLLMTKCGRYGVYKSQFDYSPSTIRASILRSLDRLQTTYLDVAYLHDVEYVATSRHPEPHSGRYADALTNLSTEWGLDPGQETEIAGPGDQTILAAVAELFRLKDEGIIKAVGITGYALPVLLRLAILVAHVPPFRPLDVVLNFCHQTLQNTTLSDYLPIFYSKARVTQVVSASPLAMGLLTPSPPTWHPAPDKLLQATKDAISICRPFGGLPAVALRYGIRSANASTHRVPVVVGLSGFSQVHEIMKIWTDFTSNNMESTPSTVIENQVRDIYRVAQYDGWSWASPQ